jgi:hypothetical protein
MKRFMSISVALLVVSRLLSAQVPGCSQAQALAADKGIDGLRTWADLHSAFIQFRACDDGAIAEGWDDFVARMLGQNWNKLAELQRLAKVDTNFRGFVIQHISNTASGDDLDQALVNAREHCPGSARRLCSDIVTAVKRLGEK